MDIHRAWAVDFFYNPSRGRRNGALANRDREPISRRGPFIFWATRSVPSKWYVQRNRLCVRRER